MDIRSKVERPGDGGSPGRSPVVVGGLQVVPEGYKVELYFRKDGSFVRSVNGVELELSPWVGVALKTCLGHRKDWRRQDLEEYEPNELMHWLEKQEKNK